MGELRLEGIRRTSVGQQESYSQMRHELHDTCMEGNGVSVYQMYEQQPPRRYPESFDSEMQDLQHECHVHPFSCALTPFPVVYS
jgi:hypothetical protein